MLRLMRVLTALQTALQLMRNLVLDAPLKFAPPIKVERASYALGGDPSLHDYCGDRVDPR